MTKCKIKVITTGWYDMDKFPSDLAVGIVRKSSKVAEDYGLKQVITTLQVVEVAEFEEQSN